MGNHIETTPNDMRRDTLGIGDKPSTPMGQATSTLEDEIDRLFTTIESLGYRMSPALGPDAGDTPSEAKNPMQENSELVRYIVDQASRVRNARIVIIDLTSRIEL